VEFGRQGCRRDRSRARHWARDRAPACRAGARIVATDLNEAVHELAGDGIATLTGDVSVEDTAKRTVAVQRFGGLDILVNNAGRALNKALLDTSVDDWNTIMAVNARGDFLHAREGVRAMIDRGGGAIVNVASVVATIAMKEMTAYASSKGAIAQLTKVIAVEHGRDNIRANAVGVGVVETDVLEGIVDDSRATLASYGDAHPIGRVAQPREIAEVIAFLAAPASSFITGTLVMADGGYTAL
jgi:NAD(P)-dependent dehydrogenase (short-subunit alcohol dehydrogenase family)